VLRRTAPRHLSNVSLVGQGMRHPVKTLSEEGTTDQEGVASVGA
jgi:hypothetical protein